MNCLRTLPKRFSKNFLKKAKPLQHNVRIEREKENVYDALIGLSLLTLYAEWTISFRTFYLKECRCNKQLDQILKDKLHKIKEIQIRKFS